MATRVAAGLFASWRMIALVSTGAAVLAGGVAVFVGRTSQPDAAHVVPAVAQVPGLPNRAPSFDVVRVAPNGNAVLAGRAEPGADIVVRDGEQELGRTRADGSGQWVLLPSAPLAPGGRELSLSSRTEAGVEARSDGAVLLVVPEPAHPSAPAAVAVLVPDQAAPRVLQPPTPEPKSSGRLGLDVLDYNDQGTIRFAGSAPPGASVRLYVDNAPLGDAVADPSGRWSMTPGDAVAAGMHRLRVDQLSPQGRVAARVELPFQRSTVDLAELAGGKVVVQPGQNLWRLARRVYGQGVRYTVIYQANREQIRNPSLIYPGQAFALPAAAP